MKRKLVKQGAATMMVSLPATWIKQNNLGKGSLVSIEPVDKNLLISPKALKDIKSETTIELKGLTESLIRTLITNTYRSGYDKINVNYENHKQFKILNNAIKTRLIGFEITLQQRNFCVVENITEPSDEQFDTIVNKIFYNIHELFEDTKQRFYNKDINLENIEEIEERIQKYDNFCRRVISKSKLVIKKPEFLWTFLTLLVHAQREIYHLNKLLPIKISSKTFSFFEETQKLFENVRSAYIKKDSSLLAQIHEKEKQLIYDTGYNLLKQKTGKEEIVIYHIMISVKEFYLASSPLAGLLL